MKEIREFPASYSETKAIANGIFQKSRTILRSEKLPEVDLQEVNEVVEHLQSAWHKKHKDPLVEQGVKVLQSHFARVFGLDPAATYGDVLGKAISMKYFEQRDPNDLEFKAFNKVMVHDLSRRDEGRENGIEIDFSGLVNPDWQPRK